MRSHDVAPSRPAGHHTSLAPSHHLEGYGHLTGGRDDASSRPSRRFGGCSFKAVTSSWPGNRSMWCCLNVDPLGLLRSSEWSYFEARLLECGWLVCIAQQQSICPVCWVNLEICLLIEQGSSCLASKSFLPLAQCTPSDRTALPTSIPRNTSSPILLHEATRPRDPSFSPNRPDLDSFHVMAA